MRLTLACVIALSLFAPFACADDSKDSKELIVWGAWRRKGLDAAFRRFEQEHPGWHVILSTAAGAGEMDPQKLMCGIAGGSPPDTLIQDRLSIGEWAIRDAFLPLDNLIRQSLEDESLARSGSYGKLIERLEVRGPSKQLDLARQLHSTMFYAFYLFNSAFRYFRMGYASAMAWVLFLIVLELTLIQLGLGRKWVHYDTV